MAAYCTLAYLVVEDDVGLLGGRTADVRPEHDVVLRRALELGLVEGTQLEVGATTVDVLLVLGAELDNQILSFVANWLVKFGREAVEASILASLNSFVVFISVNFSGGVFPLTNLQDKYSTSTERMKFNF